MSFINKSPLEYPANGYMPIRRYKTNRPPTSADYKQFKEGDEWLDTSSEDWWKLSFKDSTQGLWHKMSGSACAVETFVPDTGTSPVVPDASNEITVSGGNGILTTGALNEWSTAMDSPFEGNFVFENNSAATTLSLSVENNDTDPGSYAALAISAEPLGGDAFILFEIDSATRYFSLGIDNSDSDYFKLVHNTTPSGGNEVFMVDPGSDAFWFYYSRVTQTQANVAGTVVLGVINSDNTNPASHAALEVLTGGASGGDPYIYFEVDSVTNYSFGVDNSVVGDPFKLTDGASPSAGTEYMLLDIPSSTWEFSTNNFIQEMISIGGTVNHVISNIDATNIASDAMLSVETDPSGGDPHVHFLTLGPTQEYSFGIDNSDSDTLKLTDGASPSAGTEFLAITTAGAATFANTVFATTFDTNAAAEGLTISGRDIQADGTNTDINIRLLPKGTGQVLTQSQFWSELDPALTSLWTDGNDFNSNARFRNTDVTTRTSGIVLNSRTGNGGASRYALINVGGATGITGTLTIGKNTTGTGTGIDYYGLISIDSSGNFLPFNTNTINLGGTSNYWNNLYSVTSYATTFDTNVAAAGATLSGTTLAVDGTDANIRLYLNSKGTGRIDTNYTTLVNKSSATLWASGDTIVPHLVAYNENNAGRTSSILFHSRTANNGGCNFSFINIGINNANGNLYLAHGGGAYETSNLTAINVFGDTGNFYPYTDGGPSLGLSTNNWAKLFTQEISNASASTHIAISTAGEVTKPLQPAFLAYLATDDNNVTGNGTIYTIGTNVAFTEITDQNADFNTNGTFTSPVTGNYHLSGSVTMHLDTAATNGYFLLVTSNRTYNPCSVDPSAIMTSGAPTNRASYNQTVLADMDAGDTAVMRIQHSNGGADNDDILSAAASGTTSSRTHFSGYLEC